GTAGLVKARVSGPNGCGMACGEFGPGRMAEPAAILEAIQGLLAGAAGRPLAGKRALVTAGPTFEPIDPVRGLTNRSSGKQGYAVAEALAELGAAVTLASGPPAVTPQPAAAAAEALAELGAEVTLASGPTALTTPPGVTRIEVETALQMHDACMAAGAVDVAVLTAAVSDWRVETAAGAKIKKGGAGPPALKLVENPDILAALSAPGPRRPALVVGFAAETGDLEANARAKLAKKGCDWIVANDVSADLFGADANAVTLITADGAEGWPRQSKASVARNLAGKIAETLAGKTD